MDDWEVIEDSKGQKFYFNRLSQTTTLEKPDALKAPEELYRDANIRNQNAIDSFDFIDDENNGADPACSCTNAPHPTTMEIGASNVGFQLLKKIGWKDSQGLGKSGQGIIEPIKAVQTDQNAGVGKQEEYDSAIVEVAKERKRLDIEIDQTSEVKQQRLENAEKESTLKSDLKTMNKEFYCDICDKQYKNVQEMSNHYSSYDHHHKKRFKEMKQSTAPRTEDRDAVRKREEMQIAKEIKKRQKLMNEKSSGHSQEESLKVNHTDDGPNTNEQEAAGTLMSTVGLILPGPPQALAQGEGSAEAVIEKREKISFSMGFKMKKK